MVGLDCVGAAIGAQCRQKSLRVDGGAKLPCKYYYELVLALVGYTATPSVQGIHPGGYRWSPLPQ